MPTLDNEIKFSRFMTHIFYKISNFIVNEGCEDISEVLVGQADLLLCDRRGWNPLHTAVHLGNAGLVRMLLREDRRVVNIVTTDGLAPLHISARFLSF